MMSRKERRNITTLGLIVSGTIVFFPVLKFTFMKRMLFDLLLRYVCHKVREGR